jgi:small conductance mechanosensitive channel
MNGQLHTFWDVVHRWRADGLEFLRTEAPKIVVALIIAFVLIRLLHMMTRRLINLSQRQERISGMRAQQLRTLASVINGVGLVAILFITALLVLKAVHIDIAPLLASAGVVGLAIGFGAQTLVHDVINGFFILLENQYDIGDVVKLSGVMGTVERMTLRRTVLRDADGTQHSIPNSQITIVSNMTRDWTQTAVHVAVSYNESSDRIIGLLKEVGAELRNDPQFKDVLVADPEVPGIERVAPGEADYLMLIKTKPGAQYAAVRELRLRIKTCFEKNRVQPAGPAPIYVLNQPAGGPAK